MNAKAPSPWMVPRSPLVLLVATVAFPASLAAMIYPDWGTWVWVVHGVVLGLALLDAILVWGTLNGILLTAPDRIRAVRSRSALLELFLQRTRSRSLPVRLTVAWPAEMDGAEEEHQIEVPAAPARVLVAFHPVSRVRGEFHLRSVRLETVSPLRFWNARCDRAIQTRVCVYPDLRRDRNALAALFLSRGGSGLRSQRQIGKGRDFEKLREYVPGDGFDEIHWKATAKRGYPVTKVFQVERTQEVYVILDASRLSGRLNGSILPGGKRGEESGDTVFESMLSAALVLGQIAERQGDLFGLVVFSDRVERFLRARSGKAHYQACRDLLLRQQPREVSPDFDELASFLRLRLRRRALLLYVTVLEDPLIADSFVKHAELVSRQHLLLLSMPRSPGLRPLFSSSAVETMDEMYEQLGGHLRWADWRAHALRLERLGVRTNLVDPERLAVNLVENYLSVKQHQTL